MIHVYYIYTYQSNFTMNAKDLGINTDTLWTVFGSKNCMWCGMVKEYLTDNGTDHSYISLDDKSSEFIQWIKDNTPATKKPVIFKNGVYFGCHQRGVVDMKKYMVSLK